MRTQHSLEIELDYCVRMASRYANYYDFLPRAITVARQLNWQQTAIALEVSIPQSEFGAFMRQVLGAPQSTHFRACFAFPLPTRRPTYRAPFHSPSRNHSLAASLS